MTHLHEFNGYLFAVPRHRQLMARAALHGLGYTEEFPVDISELRLLPATSLGVLMDFLSWARLGPRRQWTLEELGTFVSFARYGE